jgi:hypothetical protein
MLEHDPLAAEFAALRTSVLTRPPGVQAARLTVRRRRHRVTVATTSLVVIAVAVLGIAVASFAVPPRRSTIVVQPTTSSTATPFGFTVSPTAPATGTRAPGPPPPRPPTKTSTGPPCPHYGAVLLDTPGTSTVSVRVDQRGQYPLCPGERVRVFAVTYTVDGSGVQHLYRSQVSTLDAAHNPQTLAYWTPPCAHAMIYVMSGNQPIKPTIPAMDNYYVDGPAYWGSPAYGPYNGVVWIEEQAACDPTP